MKLRNFIYLDTQKLYSIYSQLFNGFTESVISETGNIETKGETQKGPLGSGNSLNDLLEIASKSVEKKFLHDHAYSEFESYLEENSLLQEICNTTEITIEHLKAKPFIKIKALVRFDNYEKIKDFFRDFNEVGIAISSLSNFEEVIALVNELETQKSSLKDKGKIREIELQINKLKDFKDIAASEGLYLDPYFLKQLTTIMQFGYNDEFSLSQVVDNKQFTTYLNRDYLRESPELITRKYHLASFKEIVVIGSISQNGLVDNQYQHTEKVDFENLREAIDNLLGLYVNIEKSITGLMSNEIVIDPIAAYFELN
ncbi:DUF6414 family protein [Acinetobacter baumannii]|uniref:DUF6414 family protein n=1 Tax=Acinetobacter baumannii TaxID=470 RepID=UPI003B42E600